ncbi:MAG: hypothetical protein V3S69_06990 [Dehalococcoidales bacterium]
MIFSADDLAHMRDVQELFMQDVCSVMTYTSSAQDGIGDPIVTYPVSASGVLCGLEPKTPREVQGIGMVAVIVAKLRIPIGTDVSEHDRISITSRYDEVQDTYPVFEVVGQPMIGPTGMVLNLSSVSR